MQPSSSPPRAFIIILLCVLAAPAAARAQETVRVPDARWTFTIPQGWERIPDDALKAQNEIVLSRAPGKVNPYVLGVWRKDNPQIYALVQPFADDRMNAMSFEDIERVFSAPTIAKVQDKFKSSFSDVISSSTFGSPQLDRDRKRVVVTLSMTNPQGRVSRGVTQGLLWAGGMLNVHAYAPADQFDQKLPELLALADNVTFDPGQTFEPGSKKRSPGISPGLVGALIGSAVAIGYGVYYQRRGQRRAASSAAAVEASPTAREKNPDDLPTDLLKCFEYDGSLPEVGLCDMPAATARTVFTALLDIDADTSKRRSALAAVDAALSGASDSYRHELNSASFRGTRLPQLVIWVRGTEILAVEFRGGPEWTPPAIRAYIALIDFIRAIAPNAPLHYCEFGNPPAFEAALAVPPATPYSR